MAVPQEHDISMQMEEEEVFEAKLGRLLREALTRRLEGSNVPKVKRQPVGQKVSVLHFFTDISIFYHFCF